MTKPPNVKENLPFNVGDLIGRGSLESNRVEFKSTWSNTIKSAVVRTICAFANDLLNLNGGYVILGIEEHAGHPDLPPAGLANFNLDTMQREIRGACKNIKPDYQPVLFPTQFEDKWILIIWAPAGDNRPYQCPEDSVKKGSGYSYYIRQGSETVKALGDLQRQLLESAAKVPFDDRRNNDAKIEDISPSLVRRFLNDIRSDLLISQPTTTDLELYRRLRIVTPIHNGELPKNIGLLFFSEDPDRFFPGARVEIVQFGDAAGDLIDERVIKGPLPEQINTALKYLQSFGGRLLEKVRGQAEVEKTVAYPYEAMEEAM